MANNLDSTSCGEGKSDAKSFATTSASTLTPTMASSSCRDKEPESTGCASPKMTRATAPMAVSSRKCGGTCHVAVSTMRILLQNEKAWRDGMGIDEEKGIDSGCAMVEEGHTQS